MPKEIKITKEKLLEILGIGFTLGEIQEAPNKFGESIQIDRFKHRHLRPELKAHAESLFNKLGEEK